MLERSFTIFQETGHKTEGGTGVVVPPEVSFKRTLRSRISALDFNKDRIHAEHPQRGTCTSYNSDLFRYLIWKVKSAGGERISRNEPRLSRGWKPSVGVYNIITSWGNQNLIAKGVKFRVGNEVIEVITKASWKTIYQKQMVKNST